MADSTTRAPRRFRRAAVYFLGGLALLLGIAAATTYASVREWYPRVPPGKVGILIRKQGRALPPDRIVAPAPRAGEEPYQGVQEAVLLPGSYNGVYDPWSWDWYYVSQVSIPADNVGVRIRLFGEDLPPGQILADENPEDEARGIVRKGVLRHTLPPGTYPINTYAYDIRLFRNTTVEAGQVGVVCKRFGPMPKDRGAFLAAPGERGIQPNVLPPGSYPTNPFAEEVRPVSRQSQRLDLGVAGRVKFPSSDGFEITLTGTVEWSLEEAAIPRVFVALGDTGDAERKLLLPAARATSRLQGSRKRARAFIGGNTRQVFQDDFARELRSLVEPEGIKVHSVLVSGIGLPEDIAAPIREREISSIEREQFAQQMATERSRIELVRESEQQTRPTALAVAKAQNIEALTNARRDEELERIQATGALDVARIEERAARQQADAILATGLADAEVARLGESADAEGLRARVESLGGGASFARARFLEQIGPRIHSILSSEQGPIAQVLARMVRPSDGESAASRPASSHVAIKE